MKWRSLSEASSAVIRRLAEDSSSWFGRRGKMVRSLHELGRFGEPAAIPAISYYHYDDDAAVAQETAIVVDALIARVSPELLPALDHRIRAESYYGFQSSRWETGAIDLIERFRAGPTYASVLAVASSHASGYVRQAAVEALDREITSGVEIPFLLLRLDDWVSAVRQAAEQAVACRLTDAHRQAYLKVLPLVAQLRSRLRAGESAALARIEDLLRGDVTALVNNALVSESPRARRFGFLLAFEVLDRGKAAAQDEVLERIIHSNDPAPRLQLVSWLAVAKTAPDLQRRLLPRLLGDRSVAVRRIALAWCATHEPRNHLATLRAALLDPSGLIRSLAQFHLPKLEAIDLRTFYREALRECDRRHLKAALGGLGETGRLTDADLVVPLLDAPEPGIRRAALAALAKLALEPYFEIFVQALQSSSPGISRQARIALEGHASLVGADRLASIFADTPYPHVRRQTLCLINRLSKWQKLPLLMEIFGGAEIAMREAAEDFLQSWLWNYNRTHNIRPTEIEIVRLRRAMEAVGGKLEGQLGIELGAIAKSL
jgi:hypothetical protein